MVQAKNLQTAVEIYSGFTIFPPMQFGAYGKDLLEKNLKIPTTHLGRGPLSEMTDYYSMISYGPDCEKTCLRGF